MTRTENNLLGEPSKPQTLKLAAPLAKPLQSHILLHGHPRALNPSSPGPLKRFFIEAAFKREQVQGRSCGEGLLNGFYIGLVKDSSVFCPGVGMATLESSLCSVWGLV